MSTAAAGNPISAILARPRRCDDRRTAARLRKFEPPRSESRVTRVQWTIFKQEQFPPHIGHMASSTTTSGGNFPRPVRQISLRATEVMTCQRRRSHKCRDYVCASNKRCDRSPPRPHVPASPSKDQVQLHLIIGPRRGSQMASFNISNSANAMGNCNIATLGSSERGVVVAISAGCSFSQRIGPHSRASVTWSWVADS